MCVRFFFMLLLAEGLNPSATTQPARLSKETLAQRVFEAYSNAETLEFTVAVQQGKTTAVVKCKMQQRGIRSLLYVKGKLVTEVECKPNKEGSLVVREKRFGRINEDVSQLPVKLLKVTTEKDPPATVIWYEATRPTGTGDLWLVEGIEEYGCLVGSYFQSWLGEESRYSNLFKRWILNSAQEPKKTVVNGKPYWVVVRKLPGRTDTLYFSAETYLLERWDSVQVYEGEKPIERTRVIKNTVFKEGHPRIKDRP